MAISHASDLDSPGRLAAVRATGLLDTPPEAAFERLARLAARLVGAPVTMVSVFDADRQFVKGAVGVPEPIASGRAVPVPRSLCRHVAATGEMLAIADARTDPRFAGHPAVRDGTVAYVGVPLRDSDGFVLGTVCALDREPRPWSECEIAALKDVAEIAETEMRLRAAASRLRASEAQYRALAEAAGDGIVTAGEDGLIRYANPAAERLFGYGAGTMIGLPFTSLVPERMQARHDRARVRYVESGRRTMDWLAIPTTGRRREGAEIPVEVAFGESFENDTRIFTAVIRDVTARHAAESRLKRTSAELHALIEAAPLAIAVIDPGGQVHRWNAAAEELFGWPAEEVVGRVLPFMPADFGTRMTRVISGRPVVAEEVRRLRKDGSLVDVALSTAVLEGEVDASGAPTRIVAIYQDVTARRRADRLARAQRELLERIAAGAPLREVLDRILAFLDLEAPELCCVVRRFEPAGDALRLVASRGLPADFDACHAVVPLEPGGGPCSAVVREARPVIVPDLRTSEIFPPQRRHDLLRLGFLATWCRPITGGGRMLGTFGGYFREPRAPSDVENQLLDLVTGLLTSALEREAWAEALSSSEARALSRLTELEGIYQSAPIGIALVDRDLRFLRINDTMSSFTDTPAAGNIGRSVREVAPLLADQLEPLYRRVLDTGEPVLNAPILAPAAGAAPGREFSGSYTAVRGASGDVAGVSAVVVETTERRRLEADLREREARLDALFQNAPTGLAILDTELRYVAVNRQLAAIKSIAAADHLGRRPRDLMPDIGELVEAKMRQVLETHRAVPPFEMRADGPEMRAGDYLVTYFPVQSDDILLGVGLVVLDVTAEKSLEEQLRQSQKMEAVGRLAGGIAHDFNNLLTAILSYSEMLLTDLPPDNPLRGDVAEIRAAGERAAGLTRQLLAFSRRQVLQPRSLSLSAVVEGLDKMLRRLIGEDVELETDLAPDLHSVMADQGQIEQVLMNLAVNARDAMPEGGRLTITTANVDVSPAEAKRLVHLQAREYVTLTVSDTGQGMDAATQERIFEPFFTTKEPGKGTGLGLATVYGIVKQSGGSVFVMSEPGAGTRFTIYLPTSSAEVAESHPAPVAIGGGGSETILLVEDDPIVRRLAREILIRQGYRVIEADGGAAAVDLARSSPRPIDLLVTDVVMPKVSGQQLAAQLCQVRPGLKILFMSGYSDDAIEHHGVLVPGSALLSKPFTPESLVARVRGLLDRA